MGGRNHANLTLFHPHLPQLSAPFDPVGHSFFLDFLTLKYTLTFFDSSFKLKLEFFPFQRTVILLFTEVGHSDFTEEQTAQRLEAPSNFRQSLSDPVSRKGPIL